MNTAKQLVNLRYHLNLSVKAAARKIGVAETTWRRWEAGESEPRPYILRAIIDLLADSGSPYTLETLPDCTVHQWKPEQIAALRKKYDMSQTRFAREVLKASPATVSLLETGKKTPTMGMNRRLTAAFNMLKVRKI